MWHVPRKYFIRATQRQIFIFCFILANECAECIRMVSNRDYFGSLLFWLRSWFPISFVCVVNILLWLPLHPLCHRATLHVSSSALLFGKCVNTECQRSHSARLQTRCKHGANQLIPVASVHRMLRSSGSASHYKLVLFIIETLSVLISRRGPQSCYQYLFINSYGSAANSICARFHSEYEFEFANHALMHVTPKLFRKWRKNGSCLRRMYLKRCHPSHRFQISTN